VPDGKKVSEKGFYQPKTNLPGLAKATLGGIQIWVPDHPFYRAFSGYDVFGAGIAHWALWVPF